MCSFLYQKIEYSFFLVIKKWLHVLWTWSYGAFSLHIHHIMTTYSTFFIFRICILGFFQGRILFKYSAYGLYAKYFTTMKYTMWCMSILTMQKKFVMDRAWVIGLFDIWNNQSHRISSTSFVSFSFIFLQSNTSVCCSNIRLYMAPTSKISKFN